MDMSEFLNDALSGRADVNARDEFGQTALMGAAGQGLLGSASLRLSTKLAGTRLSLS